LQCLKKPSGVCYVAAKTFYFGVGGGIAAFLSLVKESEDMEAHPVKVIDDNSSVRREILILRWKAAIPDCTVQESLQNSAS
jgi:protein-histidine N-methyltransferase